MKHLLTLLLLTGGGGLLALAPGRRSWFADQRTSIGEYRELTLADGSRLNLNSATAIDIRFDGARRLIVLHEGEILVETRPDPLAERLKPGRPFLVRTSQGDLEALVTRFLVRQPLASDVAEQTHVAVYVGAIRIAPGDPDQPAAILDSGKAVDFSTGHIGSPGPASPLQAAWVDGMIEARDMPLADFLRELGRYRRGHLGCTDAVGGLQVSGTFPLADTDRILDALAATLPVRVQRLTPYWIDVVAADR